MTTSRLRIYTNVCPPIASTGSNDEVLLPSSVHKSTLAHGAGPKQNIICSYSDASFNFDAKEEAAICGDIFAGELFTLRKALPVKLDRRHTISLSVMLTPRR